jgi:hypothetical protein
VRPLLVFILLSVLACLTLAPACAQAPVNESPTTAGVQRLIYDGFDNGSVNWTRSGFDAFNENHNTFLNGGWDKNNYALLKRPFSATNFTFTARFRLNDVDKNLCFQYRYYAMAGTNGYFVNIKKIGDAGEYLASMEKNLEGSNYNYGSQSIFLDDLTPGTWHRVVIDGRGASINVSVDDRQVFSITDDQKPILSGSVQFTSESNSDADIDDVEIRAAPEDVYMPDSVVQPDLSFLGVTLLKMTSAADGTYLIVDYFPASRISFNGNVFRYWLSGIELGGWGLALTILAYLVVILALIIGIAEQIYRLVRRVFRRMNRSVNRSVIKGKARIYRARARSDRDGGAASAAAGPAKTIVNDVFISYSHADRKVADLICANLESKRIKCWVAPRDVPPGENYQASIIDAIDASSMMVLVFSAAANDSPHVIREITRAVSRGLVLIPFRIENVPLSKSMEYLISLPHWMEATEPPMDDHIDRLAARILSVMKGQEHGDEKAGK